MIFQNCLKFQITCNNFEKSLVVFMPNITTNHAITYTNFTRPLNSITLLKSCFEIAFTHTPPSCFEIVLTDVFLDNAMNQTDLYTVLQNTLKQL